MDSYYEEFVSEVENKLTSEILLKIFPFGCDCCFELRDNKISRFFVDQVEQNDSWMVYNDIEEYEIIPCEFKDLNEIKFQKGKKDLINVIIWDNNFKIDKDFKEKYFQYSQYFNLSEKFELRDFIPDPQSEMSYYYEPQKLIKIHKFDHEDDCVYFNGENLYYFRTEDYDSCNNTFWENNTVEEIFEEIKRRD